MPNKCGYIIIYHDESNVDCKHPDAYLCVIWEQIRCGNFYKYPCDVPLMWRTHGPIDAKDNTRCGVYTK